MIVIHLILLAKKMLLYVKKLLMYHVNIIHKIYNANLKLQVIFVKIMLTN